MILRNKLIYLPFLKPYYFSGPDMRGVMNFAGSFLNPSFTPQSMGIKPESIACLASQPLETSQMPE